MEEKLNCYWTQAQKSQYCPKRVAEETGVEINTTYTKVEMLNGADGMVSGRLMLVLR